MSPEMYTIISVAIGLAALILNGQRGVWELRKEIIGLRKEITYLRKEIAVVREQIAALAERVAPPGGRHSRSPRLCSRNRYG